MSSAPEDQGPPARAAHRRSRLVYQRV